MPPVPAGQARLVVLPSRAAWNRFQLTVDQLETTVERLGNDGATFRGEIVEGKAGRQILVEDPSGNPVELFQPSVR